MKGVVDVLLPLYFKTKKNMPLKNKLEAEDWLDDLEKNKPLKNGTHRVKQYAWGKCDALVRKCQQSDNIDLHRKALSKYAAYLRLGNSLSIYLFHWVYWRYLYGFKTPEWVTQTLVVPLGEDPADSYSFFASWSLIRTNHQLMRVTMKETVSTETTEAKQDSEVGTTQS